MIKRILPLIVIAVLGAVSWVIYQNPPEVQRGAPPQASRTSVETQTLARVPFKIQVKSYGRVKPRTQSTLLPQVSGQIVWLNPDFRAGGFFESDEELVRLDNRDYKAAVSQSEATLMSARQALAEEEARSAQAAADWKRLGNPGNAPPLVLRKPQLNAAKAAVASAEAALAIARLNLERTRIRAPFSGRVLDTEVDLGQVVSSGTVLGEIYAVDVLEVRLPLQNRDLAYLRLPEEYRVKAGESFQPKVSIYSDLIRPERWQGRIVQTEGAIDETSRQLHVLAQIDDPYGEKAVDRVPLKVGQYVTALIEGIEVPDALLVPNKAIYQGSYVYVVEEGMLQRREIEVAWQDETQALVAAGLEPGEELVLTSLGQVVSGTRVRVRGAESGSSSVPAEDAVPQGGRS
ncbi:efflux RND transporter periplasmic adaptor subunit [Marinobacterium sediminicola]|uniref:RND family efflux transporter, MFP subunit n=1 Tax=Marinobacterium sediminicola TaxID=518898 RepID=A0ABY1S1A0_9GAMM|nr:efflux RND transporter periplasmic adaptor subunit [Marinobacterium sediminicola]ULG69811.1 efflux RND transporter periplasmic adaptor subunit [Marinobacterium sediminicola]SMR75375.1 RND family efflux transporter, MFP subunit [Marinobacterium sediminicola]